MTVSFIVRDIVGWFFLAGRDLQSRPQRFSYCRVGRARAKPTIFLINGCGGFRFTLPTLRPLGQHKLSLKAGDAFHLAIAKNHAVELLLTLDEGMLKTANLLGIPAGKSI